MGHAVTILIPLGVVAIHVLFCVGLFCYCKRKLERHTRHPEGDGAANRQPQYETSLKRKMVARFRAVWNPARAKEELSNVDTLTRQQAEKVDCKENCVICFDGYDPDKNKDHALVGVVKKCGHYFHFDCLWQWLESHDSCPLCRGSAGLSENDILGIPLQYVIDRDNSERVKASESENIDTDKSEPCTVAKIELARVDDTSELPTTEPSTVANIEPTQADTVVTVEME